MTPFRICTLLICIALPLAGCAKKTEGEKKGPPAANITVSQTQLANVQVLQESVGVVDTDAAPTVAAEVPARVAKVLANAGDAVKAGQTLALLDAQDLGNSQRAAQAEVRRTEALLANQQRITERYRELIKQNFVSPTKLDEMESSLTALREQLAAAQAQLANASHNLAKTRITSPLNGRIEQRLVSEGDYAGVGKPLFQIATTQKLRVRLPFPEGVVQQIHAGLKVRLATPTAPGKTIEGMVAEVRPMIGASNRAFDAIVEVANPGDWKPGASVNGAVIIAEHPQAVVVPEASVVLRPAGKVVYVIKNNAAMQRIVETGENRGGVVEIISGLTANETVAVDGAGFLTDKAAVKIQDNHAPVKSNGAQQ